MLDMYKPHKVCVLDLVQLEGDLEVPYTVVHGT